MQEHGRLSDDWDSNFGHGELRPADLGGVWLNLSRHSSSSWSVALSYEADPLPSDEMERLRVEILGAATEVGVTVTRQVPPRPEAPVDPALPPAR